MVPECCAIVVKSGLPFSNTCCVRGIGAFIMSLVLKHLLCYEVFVDGEMQGLVSGHEIFDQQLDSYSRVSCPGVEVCL